jgi:hypothetical protein
MTRLGGGVPHPPRPDSITIGMITVINCYLLLLAVSFNFNYLVNVQSDEDLATADDVAAAIN